MTVHAPKGADATPTDAKGGKKRGSTEIGTPTGSRELGKQKKDGSSPAGKAKAGHGHGSKAGHGAGGHGHAHGKKGATAKPKMKLKKEEELAEDDPIYQAYHDKDGALGHYIRGRDAYE